MLLLKAGTRWQSVLLGASMRSAPTLTDERDTVVQIKGTAVQDTLVSMREAVGDERLASVLATLDPAHRAALQEPILAMRWYPLDAYAALVDTFIARERAGDPSLFRKRAEEVVESHLRGVYRLFVRVGSPEWLIKKIAVAHQTYFQGTAVEIAAMGPRQVAIRYSGFATRHRVMEHAIVGFYRKALELAGAREIEAGFTAPIADGRVAEITLRWA